MAEAAFSVKFSYGRSVAYLLGVLGLAVVLAFAAEVSAAPSAMPDSVLEIRVRAGPAGKLALGLAPILICTSAEARP